MEPLTIRVQADTKESLETEAAEYDVSVSEYVRQLIEKGREYDDLAERLEARESRIDEGDPLVLERPPRVRDDSRFARCKVAVIPRLVRISRQQDRAVSTGR
uniref:Hypothetical RHH domain protein n=1 Tax=uncultured virus TaxID=340016 RepID=D5L2R3_9VIRU|nr:hypothetical RHH domain protein [uncultured virus]